MCVPASDSITQFSYLSCRVTCDDLHQVLMNINAKKVANKHIVIGCTVIPGYIEGTGKYLIQDCPNTSWSYHPEFIAQGDIMNGTLKPDMALIGEGSKEAGDVLEEMNLRMTVTKPIICRMSPSSAEITKLSINCFVTMKVCTPPRPSQSHVITRHTLSLSYGTGFLRQHDRRHC